MLPSEAREIVVKHLHNARCHACGGAPSYSGEHRRPVSEDDLRRADALLAELAAVDTGSTASGSTAPYLTGGES